MIKVKVTLKSGKEIEFNPKEDKLIKAMGCFQGANCFVDIGEDRTVAIDKDEIAAVQSWPIKKCIACGRYVIPSEQSVIVDNKIVDTVSTCPACGAEITEE